MPEALPPKRDVALALLERPVVYLYLDPRKDGVVVPQRFRAQPKLVLKIGMNLSPPIPDLHLDDAAISCTLSFQRTPYFCVIPWSAVFALVGETSAA